LDLTIGHSYSSRMSADDLKQAIRNTPVRLHLSNGATYDVTHPEGALVSDKVAAIAAGDTIALVSMAHIAEVVPLPAVR
jgi:hypothetical protein